MPPRLSTYDDQLNSQRHIDDRSERDTEREPIVALRRLTAEDRRETLALNFLSAFTVERESSK